MRTFVLGMLVLCELIIAALWKTNLNAATLKFLTTLIVVVVVSFSVSAFLGIFKNFKLSRNYLLSGILGIISGIAFHMGFSDDMDALTKWLDNYAVYTLLIFILISACILFFYKGGRNNGEKAIKAKSDAEKVATNLQ